MISIVGLGSGGSRIAECFEGYPEYNVYTLDWLDEHESPEQYENSIPDLSKKFKDIDDHVQFFVIGSSFSSNYALGILEQIKDKKIELFYIKPDTELLAGIPRLIERATFGVLQEYARSGLLSSITLIDNLKVEQILQNVPIKTYYETLNKMIVSSVHYVNYFELARIRTFGALNMKTLEEKWFFDLDIDRDVCYYLCINNERLENDGGLHKRYVELLKEKPRNAFRNISYAIYETESTQDFGFCVSLTNAVQKNS
jgi:hypothetical protein